MSGRVTLTDDLLRQTLVARAANRIAQGALVNEIAEDVARTSQARPRSGAWFRWPVRGIAAASAALIAVLVLVIVYPTLNPMIKQVETGIAGPDAPALAPGRYRSAVFGSGVSFTVPDGRWAPSVNLPAEIRLRAIVADPADRDGGSLSIVRIDNVMGGDCGYGEPAPWPSPADPESFMTWLQGRLPTGLGTPQAVTIGGRVGLAVEFQAPTALRQECDFGLLLTDIGTAGSPRFAEIPIDGRRVSLSVVAVSGGLVVVIIEGGWTNQFANIGREANAVIQSLVFD